MVVRYILYHGGTLHSLSIMVVRYIILFLSIRRHLVFKHSGRFSWTHEDKLGEDQLLKRWENKF